MVLIRHFFGEFGGALHVREKRVVWRESKRTAIQGWTLTTGEHYEDRQRKQAEAGRRGQAANFVEQGLDGHDPANVDVNTDWQVQPEILGISSNLRGQVDRIHAEAVQQAREDEVTRAPEALEYLADSFWDRIPGKKFFGQIKNIIAPDFMRRWAPNFFRSKEALAADDLYGRGATPDEQRIDLANRIWNTIGGAQRAAVAGELTRMGVAPLPVRAGIPAARLAVRRLANATETQLMQLRRNAQVGPNLVFLQPIDSDPTAPYATPPTALDRLIEARQRENKSVNERYSTTKFDHRRLQGFLDFLRRPAPPMIFANTAANIILLAEYRSRNECFKLLEKMMVEHSFMKIKEHPRVQALLNELIVQCSSLGAEYLRDRLQKIWDTQPETVVKKPKEGEVEKPDVQKDLGEKLLKAKEELEKLYAQARAVGNELWTLDRDIKELGLGGAGARAAAAGLGAARGDALKRKSGLTQQVRQLETQYTKDTRALWTQVESLQDTTLTFLNRFTVGTTIGLSGDLALFGETDAVTSGTPLTVTPRGIHTRGAFEEYLAGGAPDRVNEDVLKQGGPKTREKLTPEKLLFRLHDEQLLADGITNDEERHERAMVKTLDAITQASSIGLDRAQTREIAERLGETRAEALWKFLKAKFTDDQIYEGEEIHDRLTAEGTGLEMFGDFHPSMTDEQIHVMIDENEAGTDKMLSYIEKYKACVLGFRTEEGDVDFYNPDATPWINLIRRMERICNVRRVRDADIAGTRPEGVMPTAHSTDMATKIWTGEKEEKKGILDTLKDKTKAIGRWINKNILGREVEEVENEIKSKKLNSQQSKDLLAAKGLAAVPLAIGAAATAAQFVETGGFLKRTFGQGGLVRRAGSGVWNRVLRPIGRVGYYATAPIWWPVSKIGQGVGWAGRGVGRGVAATGRFAWHAPGRALSWTGRKLKKFWDWV